MLGGSSPSTDRVRGCAGKTTGHATRPSPSTMRAQPPGLHVRLAVDRRDDVRARLELEPGEDRRALARDRREAKARVRHHVADDLDPAADALGAEDPGRALVRREQEIGAPVDRDPVALLRHRQVAAPQARLDVGDARRPRRLRARERRVRVAVHEHPARALRLDGLADRRPHRRRVGRAQVEPVRPAPAARAPRRTPPTSRRPSAAPCAGRLRRSRRRAARPTRAPT